MSRWTQVDLDGRRDADGVRWQRFNNGQTSSGVSEPNMVEMVFAPSVDGTLKPYQSIGLFRMAITPTAQTQRDSPAVSIDYVQVKMDYRLSEQEY